MKKQDVTPVQTEKRKRNDEARSFEPVKDPRLEEFLQVMQPASKTKVWANEDGDVSGAAKITEDVPMAAEEPTASDDEYQTVPKKKRRISIHEESRETPNEDQSRDTANTNPEVDETIVVASEPNQPASNADWLRSKTSRVLGLLDDEELDNANIIPNDGAQGEAPEEREPPVVDQPKATSDAGSQTDKGAPIDQQLSEAIKAEDFGNTGRLFLRNLSYVATSEELRELFAAYGNIEEVSRAHDYFFDNNPLATMIILIGTTYVHK